MATGSHYNAHTAPLFSKHNILPYRDMIQQQQLQFMHTIHYEYAPSIFNGIWTRNADRDIEHALRNAQDHYSANTTYYHIGT